MSGENSFSRGNQQERLKTIGWIVGFVDGEGCFTISLHKNPTTSSGWQIMPEFIVTQGEKSIKALKVLKNFFGCGSLFVNRRYDNHREDLYRYCVRSQKELRKIIIPFFSKYPLKTSKKKEIKQEEANEARTENDTSEWMLGMSDFQAENDGQYSLF